MTHPGLIPTLKPWGLEEIPNGPDWFTYRDELKAVRQSIHELTQFGGADGDASYYRALEKELCAQDPARFIAMWLWIQEPRIRKGESTIKPFVPFQFQAELAHWFMTRTGDQEAFDGFVSKCRGLGASWIFCALAVWAWLYRPWSGILVSRNEKLVDNRGDMNSLFGKIDFILDMLPQWMLPEGFDPDIHRLKNFLRHPTDPTVQIVGEATTSKATRGGRATYIIYDEAAFIPEFRNVFATGGGTSDHRWPVSTESFEEGDDWRTMWEGAKEVDPDSVRELNYDLNPYFDAEWEARERKRFESIGDLAGFEREYMRNPYVDGTWIYPTVRSIKGWSDEWYDPSQLLLCGIDPGRADDTAIVFMQFDHNENPPRCRWIDSYSSRLNPAEYYAHVLTGIPARLGDPAYGCDFDREAERIMEWMASLPWRDAMRVFCDPAGSQKDMSGKSFVDRIITETKRLRTAEAARLGGDRRPVPIVPLYEELFAANRHDKRRLELRKLLLNSEFSDTYGARKLKHAMENYRFQEQTGKQVNQPAPLHDANSHLCAAAEYIATFISLGLGRIKPKREREVTKFKDPLTGAIRKIR